MKQITMDWNEYVAEKDRSFCEGYRMALKEVVSLAEGGKLSDILDSADENLYNPKSNWRIIADALGAYQPSTEKP